VKLTRSTKNAAFIVALWSLPDTKTAAISLDEGCSKSTSGHQSCIF
jgi:hypothetical protein